MSQSSKSKHIGVAANVLVDPIKEAQHAAPNFDELPDSALLRESQLVPKRKGMPALLPISAPTLWRMVKAGDFPAPIKLTGRITAWRAGEVRNWLNTRATA